MDLIPWCQWRWFAAKTGRSLQVQGGSAWSVVIHYMRWMMTADSPDWQITLCNCLNKNGRLHLLVGVIIEAVVIFIFCCLVVRISRPSH